MKTTLRAALGKIAVALLLAAAHALPAAGADRLVKIDTRPGVTVSFWYMPRPGATATVVLLPGGAGGIGFKHGVPTSQNFLVRSRDLFAKQGVNVAIVGRPSDKKDLDNIFRADPRHVQDLRAVVAYLKKESRTPVWMVGTSRGTISATAAAIALGTEDLAGIVLTSSITSYRITTAVPQQALDRIRIPVLVMHHEKDACPICAPYELKYIMRGLTNAPVAKLIMVNGGADPRGDACEALHWHGYIGMEAEAVDVIVAWIKNPKP
jgi:hypothetical protein